MDDSGSPRGPGFQENLGARTGQGVLRAHRPGAIPNSTFISRSRPSAPYAQADRIDAAIGAGDALPSLAGVPLAVKDVISTRGIPTTCGSRILEGYKPRL